MLTTLEANFVQEYKKYGSPTKALRATGYNASDRSLPVIANRMMKKPEIKKALEEYAVNLDNALTKPVVNVVNPVLMMDETKVKKIDLPSREEYLSTAWKRQSEESPLKPDLKHKYFETAGRGLNYLRTDDKSDDTKKSVTIILNELNVLNITAPDLPIEPSLPDSTNTSPSVIDVT